MEVSPQSCRICLSVSEFNLSLFSKYCKEQNMIDKILVCLKLFIEESDYLSTICYKCAENIERFYDFIMSVKKSQGLFDKQANLQRNRNNVNHPTINRHVTSYVREQVIDADYTFSFLEMSHNDDRKETQQSSPFFSYFSPPNDLVKQSNDPIWRTPRSRIDGCNREEEKKDFLKRKLEKPKHLSGDIFESQSDLEDVDLKRPEWKFTPDENLLKRVREKCFGQSDF